MADAEISSRPAGRLRRELGLREAVAIGVGGTVGGGIFVLVGALALVAACTVLNLLGVKLSGRAQGLVVLVAMGGLVALVLWGLPELRLDQLGPLAPHGARGVLQAALVAFLSLGGFDMVAAAGEEVHQPERNLPRAILLTLLGVVGLYLLVALVALGSLPPARLGASAAPLAEAAGVFGGEAARRLIVGCALLTTAATANAVLVVTSRVVFAMARDRLLPGPLAAVGRRGGAPWAAVLACGAGLALVAGAGSVRFATSAGGFLYVLHFVPPLLALVVLRRRDGGRRPAFATPAPRLLLPLALAASAALAAAAGRAGLLGGGAWLRAGAVLLPGRRRLRAPAR